MAAANIPKPSPTPRCSDLEKARLQYWHLYFLSGIDPVFLGDGFVEVATSAMAQVDGGKAKAEAETMEVSVTSPEDYCATISDIPLLLLSLVLKWNEKRSLGRSDHRSSD